MSSVTEDLINHNPVSVDSSKRNHVLPMSPKSKHWKKGEKIHVYISSLLNQRLSFEDNDLF